MKSRGKTRQWQQTTPCTVAKVGRYSEQTRHMYWCTFPCVEFPSKSATVTKMYSHILGSCLACLPLDNEQECHTRLENWKQTPWIHRVPTGTTFAYCLAHLFGVSEYPPKKANVIHESMELRRCTKSVWLTTKSPVV